MAGVLRQTKCCELGQMFPEARKGMKLLWLLISPEWDVPPKRFPRAGLCAIGQRRMLTDSMVSMFPVSAPDDIWGSFLAPCKSKRQGMK